MAITTEATQNMVFQRFMHV